MSVERLSQVIVTDLRTRDFIASDESGWFAIKVTIGDTLLFTKKDFTDQKIAITTTGDLPVYMQPVISLDEVKITGQTKKQELDEYAKDYAKKGVYYNGNPPLASVLLNPLNDLHNWFGKDANDLRRFKANSESEIEFAAVHRRYTPALVKRVTNASDTVVKKFMEYYTPSYDDIKTWNDYELIHQIKKSFEFFDNNRERIPSQSLYGEPLIKKE